MFYNWVTLETLTTIGRDGKIRAIRQVKWLVRKYKQYGVALLRASAGGTDPRYDEEHVLWSTNEEENNKYQAQQ